MIKPTFNLKPLGVALLLLGATSLSMAATQGLLGSTSQGNTLVTLTVGSLVQITDISDIPLTDNQDGTADGSASAICVYSNTASNQYQITATTDAGTPGVFNLSDTTTSLVQLTYNATWDDGAGSGTVALSSGTPASPFTGFATTNCGGAGTATLAISVPDTTTVPADTYDDLLVLLVEPV